MRFKKMPLPERLLISVGILLSTGTAFIHTEFPAIPDFVIGILSGSGLGIMISTLIWQKRRSAGCSKKGQEAA